MQSEKKKTNPSGYQGYYLEKTLNVDNAIVFGVNHFGNNIVELTVYDNNGNLILDKDKQDCCLEAYNPEKEYKGVDVWHASNTSDKRWIIKKQQATHI